MLLWCCQPKSEAYEARAAAMARFSVNYYLPGADATMVDVSSPLLAESTVREHLPLIGNTIVFTEEDLSADLQYHIKLLTLLSSCNLGPKLQALYSTNDVLFAILDPATILPVKIAIGNLLIEFLKISPDKLEKQVIIFFIFDIAIIIIAIFKCSFLPFISQKEFYSYCIAQ